MTHASRDTSTGLKFEGKIHVISSGINLTKHKLYKYMDKLGIKWKDIISKQILPDEAYFDENTKELKIYEKKFQQVKGSADEKPQTCAFKIHQFKKIGNAIGAKSVTYTYLLSSWFARPEYKDMLEYIKSVEGCDYQIME